MIYLDTASTTKPSQAACNAMTEALKCFGNPSSLHGLGLESEKLIDKSKKAISQRLGCDRKKLYFTSGGTEANNTAIFGTAQSLKKRGMRIITSKIEHPSVLESFKALEKSGFEVLYVGCDKHGRISLDELESMVNDKTSLVSIMTVNNETGIIQPVKEAAQILKQKSSFGILHTDAVQGFCKVDCSPLNTGADLISISSHKIHGPKGVGALYIDNCRISPLIYGGSQQQAIRPGTENVPGIAGFGAAAEEVYDNCDLLYDTLKNGIVSEIDDIKINGCEEFASKYVLNVSFLGIKGEILLHTLENYGIYVSTGSACSSHRPEPSHVLTAMGLTSRETDGAIRFSFDNNITVEDIQKTVEILKKEVTTLRRYVRR